MISLIHKFLSPRSDGSDPTLVQPSNWNDEHTITCANDVLLGRASPGIGDVEELPCTALTRTILSRTTAAQIIADLGLQALINEANPAGMIQAFGMQAAPTGWLSCDGAAVSRTTYDRLYTAIGTTWGAGDGINTFNVPDLRGYFLRGNGTNLDGTVSGAFATKQADDNKSHTHITTLTDPGHTHPYIQAAVSATGYYPGGPVADLPIGASTSPATTGITITVEASGSEARPKNVAVLYCIKI